jgi:hypothetical protein
LKLFLIKKLDQYQGKMARFWATCLLLIISITCFSQPKVSREYHIKAVFLYHFAMFVEWPASSLGSAETPFVIGILGDDPFRSVIDETVSGEKIKGHPIIIQRYKNVHEVKNCHILYISAREAPKLNEILFAIKNRHILTVSDMANFTGVGGIIRFMTRDNKIRLQINSAAAKAADLTISSKLLNVADVVGN